MTCPRCGAAAAGNFCASCGASLKPTPCPACAAEPEPGDRFCHQCGTFLEGEAKVIAAGGRAQPARVPGAPTSLGGANTGWLAAGGLLVVLILVLAWPRIQGGGAGAVPPSSAQGAPMGGGGVGAVDLSSMTPREAADRLFDRVMRAVSAGNDAEAQQFLPMAVAAHERAMPLDADGLFHMALLQLTGQDPAAAIQTADAGLKESPDHLLLLSVAAEAQQAAGNPDAASDLYRHLLDVWDREMASGLPDYQAHEQTLRDTESKARAFLEGR